MRKTITALVAATTIAASTIAMPKPAEARCWGCWAGAGLAAGLIGGALIASNAYGYGYGPYYGYPGYYGPRPYYARPIYRGYYGHRYYAPRYYAHRYYGHRYW